MVKKILKVLYIGFGIVLGFILYIAIYNSTGYNYILDMTQEAIQSGDYKGVAMIHGGCFEAVNIAEDDSNALDVAVFRSSTLEQATYYVDDENTKEYNKYVDSYYIYLFNPNFNVIDVNNGSALTNQTCFVFYGSTGTYYYYFKVDGTYNPSSYAEKPVTPEEAIMKGERSLFSNYDNWGFYSLTLTDTMVNSMNIGTISSFGILDSQGQSVATINIALDFTGSYFDDTQELVTVYNTYIDEVTKEGVTDEEKEAAVKKFNDFYEGENGFEARFLTNPNYTFRYADNVLQPAKLVWSSIGLIALYVLGAALLYILCFHFNKVRSIFTKNAYKDYETKKPSTTKAKKASKEDSAPVVEAEIEEINEVPVEEAPEEKE